MSFALLPCKIPYSKPNKGYYKLRKAYYRAVASRIKYRRKAFVPNKNKYHNRKVFYLRKAYSKQYKRFR